MVNYAVGDKVRFVSTLPIAPKGVYRTKIYIEKGAEGTVASFHSSGNPIVKWQAGLYKSDAGPIHLDAFESGTHTDNIEPLSSDAANRPQSQDSLGRLEKQKRFEMSQNVVSHMVDVMATMYTSGRFHASDLRRMAEIIVDNFDAEDAAIVARLEVEGHDLSGMMSSPIKQVGEIKGACKLKYRQNLPRQAQAETVANEASAPVLHQASKSPWWKFW